MPDPTIIVKLADMEELKRLVGEASNPRVCFSDMKSMAEEAEQNRNLSLYKLRTLICNYCPDR